MVDLQNASLNPPARRGQALVELAILLPLLALLLVMAVDFGRVFFGWVALQNAARIGADHVSRHPGAWPTPGNPIEDQAVDQYQALVLADMQAINCAPTPADDADSDGKWDDGEIPDPTFRNSDGTSTAPTDEDGDHAVVTLTCRFTLLTPLAATILGGPVQIGSEASFAINKTATLALPTPLPTPVPTPTPVVTPSPTPTPAPCAAPVAAFVGSPTSGTSPLNVTFTDQSTAGASCPITTWLWEFGDGTTSNLEDPSHTYIHNGPQGNRKFTVRLTVTSTVGSDPEQKNNYITVQKP